MGKVTPVGASTFGHLFFKRPEGHVEQLDVLEGGVHHAASHLEEFGLLLNSRPWRDTNLLSHGVGLARSKGLRRTKGQFFGFAHHPGQSGRIDWTSLACFDAKEWHAICAKALDNPHQTSRARPHAAR